MTQESANRLLAVVLVLAEVTLVPVIASRLAVQPSLMGVAWTAAMLTLLTGCIVYAAMAALRAASPRGPARALIWTALLVVASRTVLLWPLSEPVQYRPWAVMVIPLVIGASAIAFSGPTAMVCVVLLSATLGLLRTTPGWQGLDGLAAVEEAVFMVGLGTTAVIGVSALRIATDRVTEARSDALEARVRAEGAAAAARESARWDALIHDDVLSALATAVHADRPELVDRAGAEAERALHRIRTLTSDGPEPADVLVSRLVDAVRTVDRRAVVHVDTSPGARPLPRDVADALVDAVVEAVRNAVRHAGAGALVQVHGDVDSAGTVVSVRDDGRGFDPEEVPPERLGLRVSVRARLEAVGGSATWHSRPGRGTRVDLRWPT